MSVTYSEFLSKYQMKPRSEPGLLRSVFSDGKEGEDHGEETIKRWSRLGTRVGDVLASVISEKSPLPARDEIVKAFLEEMPSVLVQQASNVNPAIREFLMSGILNSQLAPMLLAALQGMVKRDEA